MRPLGPVTVCVLGAILAAGSIACDLSLINRQDQRTPTSVSVEPVPSPSPSADPGPAPAVDRVGVAEWGRENCGALVEGLPAPPCKVLLTCTPRDSEGNDVALSYVPAWRAVGDGGVTPTSNNPYNARGECDDETGTVLFVCEVGGVEGSKGYECE